MNEKDLSVNRITEEDRFDELADRENDKLGSRTLGNLRAGQESLFDTIQPEKTTSNPSAKRRYYSRSKNPDNDSDQDPYWRGGSQTERTPDEEESCRIGIAACRAALQKNKPSR